MIGNAQALFEGMEDQKYSRLKGRDERIEIPKFIQKW